MGSYIWSIKCCHFQWLWVIPKLDFKGMPLFDVEYFRYCKWFDCLYLKNTTRIMCWTSCDQEDWYWVCVIDVSVLPFYCVALTSLCERCICWTISVSALFWLLSTLWTSVDAFIPAVECTWNWCWC